MKPNELRVETAGASLMRILHIIQTIDPRAGGPSEAVGALLRYAPEGFAGEVVTLDDPQADFVKELPFAVHAIGPATEGYGRNSTLLPWLRANGDRFDGVVVHGLWRSCGYAAWRVFGGRKPYVVFPHGMLDPYFKRAFPMKHWKKWIYWLTREYWVLRGATQVLFTCREEMRLAPESFWLHRWKGRVVPFGASAYEGDPEEAREAFFRACPDLRGRRFLLFLGRIHPKKGCDMLVEAFAKLAEGDPGLELVMAGPDASGWRTELNKTAARTGVESRVHWPGMLSGDVKWGAFYASEAFILPSHQENFGMAVAEALSCGRQVLLSDKVNIARDIAEEGAGLVETDTLAGTERLLERWMRMPAAEREAMRVRAVDCYRRDYDIVENAKTIVRLCVAESLSGAATAAGTEP